MSPPPPRETSPAAREPRSTLVFGVLGGIASGKSRVAELLAGPAGLRISADEVAGEVLDDPEIARSIRERFGARFLGPEGRPDRAALAELVFDAERGREAKEALEGWIHPRVRARILGRLREAEAARLRRVALDVPLLLENDAQHGLVDRCDALLFVDADLETRDRRAIRSRGWAPGEVARREALQFPLPEKRKRADFVVVNQGSLEELERSIEEILRRLDAI
jgi:dephospho-CoA kinase